MATRTSWHAGVNGAAREAEAEVPVQRGFSDGCASTQPASPLVAGKRELWPLLPQESASRVLDGSIDPADIEATFASTSCGEEQTEADQEAHDPAMGESTMHQSAETVPTAKELVAKDEPDRQVNDSDHVVVMQGANDSRSVHFPKAISGLRSQSGLGQAPSDKAAARSESGKSSRSWKAWRKKVNSSFNRVPSYIDIGDKDYDPEGVILAEIHRDIEYRRNSGVLDEKSSASHSCIVDPLRPWRLMWDGGVLVFILYQGIAIPIEFSFYGPGEFAVRGWLWIDLFIGLYFIADIFLNCMTAQLDQHGRYIRDQRTILWNYLVQPPFFLILDVFAAVPTVIDVIELVGAAATEGGETAVARVLKSSRALRYMRALKLARLLRTMRAMKIVYMLEEMVSGSFLRTLIKICKLLSGLFFILHLVACSWRAVAHYQLHAEELNFGTDETDVAKAYAISLWWAITTIVSNDPYIDPKTTGEFWLWSGTTVLGATLLGVGLGGLLSLFDTLAEDKRGREKQMRVARAFIAHHHLPPLLKAKVLGAIHSSHLQQKRRGEFKALVEPLLSQDVRLHLYGSIHGEMIQRFPPFRDGDPAMMSKFRNLLAYQGQTKMYSIDDIILQEGQPGDTMVFFVEGEALLWSNKQQFELEGVTRGWWLGERVVFWDENSESKPVRSASCKALTPCTTLELHRNRFLEAVGEFKLQQWLKRMQLKIIDGTPWGCPACGEEDHWFRDCPMKVAHALPQELHGDGALRVDPLGVAARQHWENRARSRGFSRITVSASVKKEEPGVMSPIESETMTCNESTHGFHSDFATADETNWDLKTLSHGASLWDTDGLASPMPSPSASVVRDRAASQDSSLQGGGSECPRSPKVIAEALPKNGLSPSLRLVTNGDLTQRDGQLLVNSSPTTTPKSTVVGYERSNHTSQPRELAKDSLSGQARSPGFEIDVCTASAPSAPRPCSTHHDVASTPEAFASTSDVMVALLTEVQACRQELRAQQADLQAREESMSRLERSLRMWTAAEGIPLDHWAAVSRPPPGRSGLRTWGDVHSERASIEASGFQGPLVRGCHADVSGSCCH
eukprot:TRINITY_DN3921_c0_g1_i4.p1 TRINITY_DN3921_c0_g1~~TRINITY_DN3921_c0_g1_i4.p1  ORF type:complete len:1076 (+),score=185.80 TRINITY_DN3921_c0_g1_i4:130-3357(+)